MIRTPILEFTELHERKSGAGIVSKLFELASGGPSGVCLRPELTASIVRAFTQARECPPLPWRVSSSGPVFRYEGETGSNRLREFNQVGVELLGAGGPAADAEVIALADRSLSAVSGSRCDRADRPRRLDSGDPGACRAAREASSALVEMMSAAAAEGQGIQALDSVLDRLVGWLRSGGDADLIVPAVSTADDRGVDRLFRQLVPDVTGRRSGHEIIHRLRRKWDLSHSLSDILGRVRDQFHASGRAARAGPGCPGTPRREVRLARAAFRRRARRAGRRARPARRRLEARVELDLGFSRGIGFYTQMIFGLEVRCPRARSRSAAAAATTGWPACSAAAATTAGPGLHSGWNASPRSVRRGRPAWRPPDRFHCS